MEVLQIGPQQVVTVGEGSHGALDEVGRVPDQSQLLGSDRLHDVQAALRVIAVDVLLVLVQEHHVMAVGCAGQRSHPAQHLVAVPPGFAPRRDEEREQPDVGRVQDPGNVQRPLKPDQMLLEVVSDRDLADRRADR